MGCIASCTRFSTARRPWRDLWQSPLTERSGQIATPSILFDRLKRKEGRMRKTTLVMFSLLFVLVAAIPAYATDCSAGITYSAGGFYWTDYSAENLTEQKSTSDCWSMFGLSATTLSFDSKPGFA